ncbi:MAG: helix-hairpin-helix domain-containing protein [bacterium]
MESSRTKNIFLAAMVLATNLVSGQTGFQGDTIIASEQNAILADQVEKSAEALDMEYDFSEQLEDYSGIAEKPVNLNSADEEELKKIPFLTAGLQKSLFNYVAAYGEVLSIYELASIPGFDSALVQRIQPYVLITPPSHIPKPTPKNLVRYGHHSLLLKYEQSFPKSQGYLVNDSSHALHPDSYYPGSPQRYYFRYNYTWFDKLQIGIAGEKDPGEQFFKGAQSQGMDYYAAYLSINNIGILKNLTVGNYRVSFGQGLTFGSGLSLGSVPGFSTGVSLANGIRPSLSMNEGSYLRGLAATLKIKRLEISGFASYHPCDATVTLTDSITSPAGEISSITTTGYHRTKSEIEKRNALTELVCGGNVSFSMAPTQQFGFKIGLTGVYSRYSAGITPEVHPYSQFGFRGNQNMDVGFDFQARYRGMYLFGEISGNPGFGMAWIIGSTLKPDPGISITMIYRNYQSTYRNTFANAFGQNSQNANERGIYTAINAAVHPKLNLSGYLDLFIFPWLKYRVDAPSKGQEFGLMMDWKASAGVLLNLKFYQKNTQINTSSEQNQVVHKLCDYLSRSYRFGMEWIPGNGIYLKTRIEIKEAGESAMQRLYGYLLYQDVQLKVSTWLENITFRMAIFDIPDYAARIYVYEPEVLYGYSVPAYQGKGLRNCLVLKFGISRKFDVWLRGGLTYYTDRNEVGTGLDMTEGNIRGEVTGQLLIKL